MSVPNKLNQKIFPGELARLESIIERFENAWQRGQPPALDEYLKASDVEPRKLVIELAHVDLECRLKAGEAARVEIYLDRYADLAGDRAAALGLIEAEYQLRQRREPTLGPDEYLRRFPQYREHLAERLRGPHLPAGRLPSRLTCPQCCKSITLDPSTADKEVTCTSCGARFLLDLEEPPLSSREGPPRLAQFELLEAIGQGAFGTVYRARDTELKRIVAVKVPRSGRSTTPLDVQRMVREARSAARLNHPGIVPVYEVSRGAPVPYIVSAYVEGTTLAEVLAGQRLAFQEAADITAQVAEALDHAHAHGVVHRDLKPSNIILGRIEGELKKGSGVFSNPTALEADLHTSSPAADKKDSRPLFQRAFVMDFGLARQDEGEVRITLDGQILGTPAYMSPEQARGQSHHVDGRSDIHSLGVILYEMLTGELPFRGVARMMLQQILTEEPRSPRRLNDKIPRDLETITLKCLAKEPGRRYETAGALAGDLRRYQRGEPILARPVNRLERLWRWSKRNPRVAALSVAVFLLLATLAIGSPIVTMVIIRQRDAEVEARDKAETNANIANQQRKKAKAAQHQAEQQLDLTLHTLNNLIYEVHDHLLDDPAMFKLQERLVRTAIAGLKRMARSAQRAETQHSMATAYGRMGDIFLLRGQTKEARKYYQLCLGLATRLRAANPDSPKEKRGVSFATMKLGEIGLAAGDTKKAGTYCRQAVNLFKELAQANPKDREAKQDLVRCYKLLGQVEVQQGDARTAAQSFHQAVDLAKGILAIEPHNADVKLDLALSYTNLGDASLRMVKVPPAREAFGQALKLYLALAAAQPGSARCKRNLAVTYQKLGDIAVISSAAPLARTHYLQAQKWCEELFQIAPLNSQGQRDLAVAYGKLGEVSERLSDDRSALNYYAKARERLEKLSAAAPGDAQARRDVVVAYQKLGAVHQRLGDGEAARTYRDRALKGYGELAAAHPGNVQAQADLAAANGACGLAEMQAKDYARAAQYFQCGLTILQELAARGKIKDQPLYQNWLHHQQRQLAVCRKTGRAIQDLSFALAQPPAEAAELLLIRATVLAGQGQHAPAALTAEKLRALAPNNPGNLYNVACCYGLCVAGIAPGKKPGQRTPDESAQRAKYAARAIEALTEAVRRGYKEVRQLRSDPDLAAIRSEKGYQKVVESLATGK